MLCGRSSGAIAPVAARPLRQAYYRGQHGARPRWTLLQSGAFGPARPYVAAAACAQPPASLDCGSTSEGESTLTDPGHTAPEPPSQHRARLVVAAVFVVLGLWILHDFLPALAWAVVLSIALVAALSAALAVAAAAAAAGLSRRCC